MRVAIYSRFSSDQQNPRSAADQTRLCRTFAEVQGWQVTATYEDLAISGASKHRPEFQRLVADAKARRFDVVVCEALDRLGRKLADVAELFDQLSFLGIGIHTLQQGPVTQLHIGMLGTMSQLFLADLKAKTRRGLRAVAEDGRSAGGRSYGYRLVPGENGRRGHRAIDPTEAAIILRIFEQYAAGVAPKRIAFALNAEGIPGPRGGAWAPSAINGDRRKGTGLLNNTLYIGRQVWGRREWLKHPDTGKRVARTVSAEAQVVTDIPGLRIIDEALWERVKARQALLDSRAARSPNTASDAAAPFWAQQRPRYLFSGLMVCGACGGGFSKISAAHFGCSTARNKGETACTNRLTIRRDLLEETVLGALRARLMDPDLFRAFVAAFTAEWNRLQAETSAGTQGKRQELGRVMQQIERLVDAIAEGTPAAAVRDRMTTLETRRLALAAEIAEATEPAPRLHPALADVYRERVARLAEVLEGDDATEAREQIRGLVEAIRLLPEGGALRIEVRGALGAILALAEGARDAKSPGGVARAFMVQGKRDAGTGFEPVTFRL